MTSRKSTCTPPPVDLKPKRKLKRKPKRVGDCKDLTQKSKFKVETNHWGRPNPNEKVRFWPGDRDSQVYSASSCVCSCNFDTPPVSCQSALPESRSRALVLSAAAAARVRASTAAAATWDGGRYLVCRRGHARRPSCSRAGTYHRRAHDEGSIRSLTVYSTRPSPTPARARSRTNCEAFYSAAHTRVPNAQRYQD
jgi:hypothetical protein